MSVSARSLSASHQSLTIWGADVVARLKFSAFSFCAAGAIPAVLTQPARAAAAALAGCVSTAGIAPAAQKLKAENFSLATTSAPQIVSDWWDALNDRALTDMIGHALEGNPSLRVARLRIDRAQAAVAGAESAQGPQVSGDASVTRQRFSENSIYPPPLGGS